MENLKKLINYNYDCIKEILKSSSFLKLKPENVYILSESELTAGVSVNNKQINKLLIEYKKNKSMYNLLCGAYFVKNNNNIYTPLYYADIEEIKQDGGAYVIDNININYELNINLLVNIFENSESEFIIDTLLKINDITQSVNVLKSFINNDNIEIIPETALILAKLPESTAGILNELKKIHLNIS